jgi:hypothetical protein
MKEKTHAKKWRLKQAEDLFKAFGDLKYGWIDKKEEDFWALAADWHVTLKSNSKAKHMRNPNALDPL